MKQGGKGESRMSNGEERFDYSGYKRDLDDFVNHHFQGRKVVTNSVKACNTVDGLKRYLEVFTNIYFTETGVLLHGMRTQLDLVQGIEKVIDALPDRREFDEGRKEMKSLKAKVRQTLQPIKEWMDESKKRTERGYDVYG